MRYWLMKSEPDEFGIDDLRMARRRTECWDGVRNYQSRNMMRDEMKKGDLAFFYHSSCAIPGIAGIMEIVREGYPDQTAFDLEDKHHDPKSDPDNPRWFHVDIKFVRKLQRIVSLSELRMQRQLQGLALLRRGNRLSIMPVSQEHWDYILSLE